jgi:P-type E1-E2 ATPase
VRDGQERKIADIELVVGDIVYIRSGGRVPADIRILQSNGLKLEASSITGEDEPIEITHEATAKHVSVFDSKNVAFNGCYCVEGEAIGIVIRTGNYTV